MIRRQTKGTDVKVTFALPTDSSAPKVSVVGDFNAWTPGAHTLVKRANGTRSVSVTLPRGSAGIRFRQNHRKPADLERPRPEDGSARN